MCRYLKVILLLACTVCIAQVHAQVTASFTASQTSGCSPLIINFTNTSTGATSYTWTLGNGNNSFFPNATATYTAPGTYTVTLTATGSTGSATSSIQVTVQPPPTVSFSGDTAVCIGATATFVNTTSPMAPGTTTYSWQFGDGLNSTLQAPPHAYGASGFYTVTQTATNSYGCAASLTINSLVHVLASPVAQFSTNNNSFCSVPSTVIFTDQSTGSSPFTYSWTFGDGTSSPAASPTHNYLAAGSYNVQEIVTDRRGCKDTLLIPNNILVQNLRATMNVPDTGCAQQTIAFQNTTPGSGATSYWIFGDGTTDNNTNTTHIYATDGTYTVKMIAFLNGCIDTTSKQIFIRPIPVGSFTYTPPHPCPAPVTVQFTSSAPTGSTYTWNFGDGSPVSTQANPSHTYNLDTFMVASLIINNHGCMYVTTNSVNIYSMFATISNKPNGGCPPLHDTVMIMQPSTNTLNLSFPVPYPWAITSTFYDFGDGGATSTTDTSYHTYTSPNYYHTTYSFTTANGCLFTDTTGIIVGQPPTIDYFYGTPLHICRRDTITLHAHAHGAPPILYTYNYGGQSAEGGVNDTLVHRTLLFPGTLSITLTASNYGCAAAIPAPVSVIIDSPSAFFQESISCALPSTALFLNASIGATSYVWLFGDGTPNSTIANPSHSYSPGFYAATLAVYNSRSGCRDTSIQGFYILDFRPSIVVADTAICKHSYLNFSSAYNLPNPPPRAHNWYINNNPFDTTAQLLYQFDTAGIYIIDLKDRDYNGCPENVQRKILVAKPIAGFNTSTANACLPANVLFTDNSYYITGTYPVSHIWDFGDGRSGNTSSNTINHTYTLPGTFGISEIVIDNLGCTDTVLRPALLTTHKPTASFAVANTFHCAWDTITFVNTGTSANLRSTYWTFGDGAASTAANPVHAYVASGTYTVTLKIVDTTGCSDSIARLAFITISKPHAAFAELNGSGVCVPLIVQFNNTSTGGSTYNWSFGNTNTSLAPNPSNSYAAPGNYNVQLIVTDAHGCKDTAYNHVTLYGYSGSFSYSPLYGCPPLPVNFTATITGIPNITYDFSDGSVAGPGTATNATHTYLSPGKYVPKIILVDSAGCHTSSYGTDTIKVDRVHAAFSETKNICIYDTVHFTDASSGLFAPVTGWTWYFGDAATTNAHNPAHTYHTAGTFNVTLIASDGASCKDTAVAAITVHALPVITASGDTTICPADSAKVLASGGISYIWAPLATINCPVCNPTYVRPLLPSTYIVTGTDAFGCVNKDSVKILFTYKTVSHAGPGGEICTGQSIQLSDSGAQVYHWYPATGLSNAQIADPIATPTGGITYLAIAQTASCIPDTNYVSVVVDPLPTVKATGAGTVIAGGKTNLQAYGPNIISFLWNHSDELNCDDCPDPIATMQQTTQFTVTATNQYGCRDSASVEVKVLCDKSQMFIPNTFTPNGDGQNDVFYPRGIGIKTIRSMRIYNRWGQLVFEKDNININDESSGWDGTYKGAKPVPDTYVYAIDAICDEGTPIDWKGDITLLK